MTQPTENMEKVSQGLVQACDEMSANCCRSVDAMMEATSAMSKGCEEFSRKLGSLMQQSVTNAVTTSKTMMSARNLKEVTELQAEFMKEFFDSWMAGAGRLSEISARTTHEAFEPVARQANDTMGKAAQVAQKAQRAAGSAGRA